MTRQEIRLAWLLRRILNHEHYNLQMAVDGLAPKAVIMPSELFADVHAMVEELEGKRALAEPAPRQGAPLDSELMADDRDAHEPTAQMNERGEVVWG